MTKCQKTSSLLFCKKYLSDCELARHLNLQSACLTTYDLAHKEAINRLRAKQTWTASGSSDPMDLSPLGKGKSGKKGRGKGKGDTTAKPQECFYSTAGKPGHNKNQCRNFSAALRQGWSAARCIPTGQARKKPTGRIGTGAVSPAPGLDACVLHEDDSDQDAYLFPLPMFDESNDSPEELRGRCAQQRSDQRSNRAIRKSPTAPGRRHESCSFRFQVPQHGCWYSENRRKVRREKRDKTDRCCRTGGQGVWLNGDGGFILDVKSARKVEKLLGDKRGFVKLRKQKGMYVIPCEEQPSNLLPLAEQESSQGIQMDRGEVDVEEERQARVKSAPVLPTDKEREEHEVTHATFRSWCEACAAGRATEDSHKRSATEPSVPLVAMDHGFLGRDTDVELATILVLIQRPPRCFAKAQSLVRSTVCWRTSIPGA